VELFGVKYPSPVVMGPVGVQGAFHEDREIGTASVCRELGIPFSMSSASTSSIEEIAAANKDGKRWFQLYWPHDDDLTISILNRAKQNGFSVLLVTLDTFQIAW
jgi:lactate 2-monooxygenase